LQRAAGERDVRFHLMGHSFGCIAASALVAGPKGCGQLVRPVESLTLVQGAMSLWSYCTDIPATPGQKGYFRSVVADRKVRGPILTTRTPFDTAVGRFYPLGAGVRQQVSFAPGELPTYGAVGAFGLRGSGLTADDKAMLPTNQTYGFQPGHVYNLECSEYIRQGSGADGAHGDFLHPEVAHAVWEAALT
jgi:pimeloyl-ACP methyl ester carboxylesterase